MILKNEKGQKHIVLNIPLYKQTTDFTCGACATLMVWKYFDRSVQLSKRNEFLIWTEIAALPFKFSSPYRIAALFINKGFKTKLIMKQGTNGEGKILLKCCQTNPAERKLFIDFFKAHCRILKRNITSSIVDRNPTLHDIRRALLNNSPVIALVDSYYTSKTRGARNPPHLPHWIVIRGYRNERFYINDPIQESGLKIGKIIVEGRILEEAMNTYARFRLPPALIIVGLKVTESISSTHRANTIEQKSER
jgi:hypothetical protein